MSTATKAVSRNEADLIVRHIIANEIEEVGYYWAESDKLGFQLSYYTGALIQPEFVDTVLEAFKDLSDIDDRTHEDLRGDCHSGTDNVLELTEYYECQLNIAVNQLLDDAGFPGKWINRYTGAFSRAA